LVEIIWGQGLQIWGSFPLNTDRGLRLGLGELLHSTADLFLAEGSIVFLKKTGIASLLGLSRFAGLCSVGAVFSFADMLLFSTSFGLLSRSFGLLVLFLTLRLIVSTGGLSFSSA
jgi:hypothetical protein